jgi:hypothetical protein
MDLRGNPIKMLSPVGVLFNLINCSMATEFAAHPNKIFDDHCLSKSSLLHVRLTVSVFVKTIKCLIANGFSIQSH